MTTYHNCFFASLGKSYTVSDYTITENASVQAEFMSSTRGGVDKAVADSQGVGGSREISGRQIDPQGVEQSADVGTRRGSLDYSGLITAAFENAE